MKIESFQVTPPKVEGPCTGSFTVVNTGPGYENDPAQVLPYWMLTIADSKGTPLYKGAGTWSGPVATGGRNLSARVMGMNILLYMRRSTPIESFHSR